MTIKKYTQLSKGSKEKLRTTLERLHKSGITVKDVKTMSDLQIKKALGFKGKKASFLGLKRNINQLQFDLERKEGVSNSALPTYVKFGYRGKKLSRTKNELRKTVGLNIFFDIAKKVQKEFKLTERQSYKRTDLILKQANINYKNLSKREKELLSYFS